MIRCENLSKSFKRACVLDGINLGRDAKLLIMDEPAANLDPEGRKIFFDLPAERQQSATMLISSHRIGEVAGPDRLRFIGMLSRYVALIADLSLSEKVGAGGTAQ